MNEITLIEKIKKESNTIIFLAKKNNKEYELERQKILPIGLEKNTEFYIWREIEFYEWINKLEASDSIFYKRMFFYKTYDCLKKDIDVPDGKNKEFTTSPYCLDILIEHKNGTLDEIIPNRKLTGKQKYSITIQSLYAIYLMQIDGYYHRNIKLNNICYTKCEYDKKLTIKIDSKIYQIQSYGYIISLAGYERVTNDKFNLNTMTRKSHDFYKKYNLDVSFLVDVLLLNNIMIKYTKKITDKEINHTDILRRIVKLYLPEYNETKKTFANIYGDDTDDIEVDFIQYEIIILFEILHKKKFCEILGIEFIPNFIKDEHIELIKFNMLYMKVPIETLIQYLNGL